MTQDDATRLALAFVKQHALGVNTIVGVRYVTLPALAQDTSVYPPDLLDTYHRVKASFRDHWVVEFRKNLPPGVTESPGTELVCIYDNGDIYLIQSL
jgi:hypothetical protein